MSALDTYFDGLAQQQQTATDLNRSLSISVDKNPDEYARYVRLYQKTGIDPDHLMQDQDTRASVERDQKLGALDMDRLIQTNPRTAKWLSDPKNAGIAHDDVDNLGFFETLWNSTKRGIPALRSIVPAMTALNQASGLQQLDYVDEMLAQGKTPDESRLGVVASQYAAMTPEQRSMFRSNATPAAEKLVSQSIRQLGQRQSERAAIPLPGVVGRVMAAPSFGEALHEIAQDPARFIAGIGPESLLQSAPGLLAAVPAGLAAGPTGVAGAVGANSFITDYASTIVEAMQSQGIDVTDQAALAEALQDPKILRHVADQAGKHAAVVGIFDALSGGLAGKSLVPAKIAGRLVSKPLVRELANIGLQLPVQAGLGAAGEAGGELAAGQDIQPGNILAEAFGEMFGTPSEVVTASAKRYLDGARAQESQAFLDALAKGITDSKLHQRLPEKTREFIAQLRADSNGPQNVYIDARQAVAYFQSVGMDSTAVAEAVTGDPAQLQRATELGSDWVIPVEDFAAKLAGTEHLTGLRDDLKLNPGDLSPRELAAQEADRAQLEARIAALVKRAQRQIQEDKATQTIYQDLYGQAVSTGAAPSTAEAWATLVAAHYRTRAARLGMDQENLWAEEGLKVTRQLPAVLANRKTVEPQLDSRLDMLRSGTVPSQTEMFGPSLLEFLREKGGLQDMGGELSARDAAAGRRPFQKNIIQSDGLTFDHARELAAEAGFPVGKTEASFLDALDQELRGNPVYAPGQANSEAQSLADELKQIAQALEAMGIDLSTLSNEQVRGQLDQVLATPDGESYGQDETPKDFLDLFDEVDTIDIKAPKMSEQEINDAERTFLSAFPKSVTTYRRSSGIARRLRRASDLAADQLGDNPEATRRVDQPLGPFSGYVAHGVVLAGDDAYNQGGILKVKIYGKEQVAAGLTDEPALTFTVMRDGELSVNGPTPGGATFKAFQERGWAEQSKAGDRLAEGWSNLTNPDGGKLPITQTIGLLADVHARVRAWRMEDYSGLHWARATGALAGIGDNGSAIFFQGDDAKRGAFYPDTNTIALLEKADLSTFLHELGHSWLEGLNRDAKRPDAPQQVKDDWQKTAEWLGIDANGAIPVEAHEQWARGAEAYFAEGKAPAFELRELFRKFSAWVKSVYRDLTRLNVQLTEEVRGVMDRLIATDEEISQAEGLQQYEPIFADAKAAGVTDAEWTALQVLREKARSAAEQQAVGKVMRELQREQTKWWQQALDTMRGEVTREAQQAPAYIALQVVSLGEFFDGTRPDSPVKLSREALVAMYGEPYLKTLSAQALRTHGWIYAKEGGLHPDAVAPLFGFDSGDAMVKAMVEAPNMKQWIEAETKRRMLEVHGDMVNDGGLANEAMAAVHNDQQADVLLAELKLLNRKAGRGDITPGEIYRDAARREIGKRRIDAIDPAYYLRAERKAGKEAFDAVAKDDFMAAAEAKQRQLLNLEFYRAARDGREEAGKAVAHLKDLTKSRARARIGKAGQEWLAQLDGILERYSFAPMSTSIRARSLAEWYATVNDPEGLNAGIAISPDVLDEARRQNYRELTLDELRAVADSVRSIEHVAKKITQVVKNGQAFEMEQIIGDIEATVAASPLPDRQILRPGDEQTALDAIRDRTYTLMRPEKIFEWLDNSNGGIFHDLFWNRAAESQAVHDDLKKSVMQPLVAFVEDLGTGQEQRLAERLYINGLGRALTRYELIGIALNVGNTSNLDKLMRGGLRFADGSSTQIDSTLLQELLDPLTADDWRMVQTIWDTVGNLYPQLNELNQRVSGLPLAKVDAQPVVTKHGTVAGGYWPAVGDPDYSQVGKRQDEAGAHAADLFPSPFPNAATAHSFRQARTNAAYPLSFDWRKIISRHVSQATTDIAYAEFVADANRLLNNGSVQRVLQSKLGREQYQGLRDWLKHQVAASMGGYNGARSVDSTMNGAIANMAVAALGYKVATAWGNLVVAPVQASHQVKGRFLGRGYWEYLRDPKGTLAKVQTMSGEMRHRGEHLDQTFNAVLDSLAGKPSLRKTVMHHAMLIHTMADRIGTTGIWLGKYYQEFDRLSAAATNEHDLQSAESEARRLADKTIRTTQTAGAPKDLSSFERDPRYAPYRLFLGPMIIMQNEMRGAAITKRNVAMTLLATWLVPAVLFELAVGRGPGDDEDWLAWMMRKIAIYPLQTVPLIRDAAGALESLISHKPGMTRSNPITDMALQMITAAKKLGSDNADVGDKTAASLQAIGVATGMPGYAAGTAGNYLLDLATGETDVNSPLDARYLFIKRDSDRRD